MDYSSFKFAKGKSILKDNKKGSKGILVRKKRIVVSDNTYKETYKICDGKCALCGTNKDLHLHHINGRGKFLTDNIENCIFLCINCHLNIVHKNLKKYRPILLKIRKELK